MNNNSLQKVVLIGRPNVGKSTLFNRLAGKRLALVHDEPGVTRDRREARAQLFNLSFIIVDTAGLMDTMPNAHALTNAMLQQTAIAVKEADIILLVIDGRAGVVTADEELATFLRRSHKTVVVIVNKCEGRSPFPGASEAHGLGFNKVITLSAEHGEGLNDLYDALNEHLGDHQPEEKVELKGKPLELAIIGRPNAGKSTLLNQLLGEERTLTGEIAGTTRDSIGILWGYRHRSIHIIDTAGLRKSSKVVLPLEKLATEETYRILRYAEVVILVVDALTPLEKQDLTIAQKVLEEGRALVIAINKIDQLKWPELLMNEIEEQLVHNLAQVKDIPCVGISAKTGLNCEALLEAVLAVENLWNKRVSTAALNRWLEEVSVKHPPPLVKGKSVRLKYMTQIKTRPPSFVLFASQEAEIPESYKRYLLNQLRIAFEWPAVPLRLTIKRSKNPFVNH